MKFLLDTANLETIAAYAEDFPISGITSNPTIVKREKGIDFFAHMTALRTLVGRDAQFHVQVSATDVNGMLRDADALLTRIDDKVTIKVPVTRAGLKVIKTLHAQNVSVTGTAIFTRPQGLLAMEAGAAYIAPYFNRMENLGINPRDNIAAFRRMIERYDYPTQILVASFKNVGQINDACENGAHIVTIDPVLLDKAVSHTAIQDSVRTFGLDWGTAFGGTSIADLP